ncbi:MAG TPA: hypothetical protein PKL14_08005 [Holophaga sp.]|jgi:hypothetical protein|nr:hypothetical protein [Holophaga sp.]
MAHTRILLPQAAIVAGAVLLSPGCSRQQEPQRAVPPLWLAWEHHGVSFRFPAECAVAYENTGLDYIKVLVSTRTEPQRLILRLDFGEYTPFPRLKNTPALMGKSVSTRIWKYDAERFGPRVVEGGARSECLIELGGKGSVKRAHACYANLDPAEQDLAETIIGSIRRNN